MEETRGNRAAFGKPGIEPKWTQGNKDGVGTAYSGSRANDTESVPVALASHFLDIPIPPDQRAPIRFTFLWTKDFRWEGNPVEARGGRCHRRQPTGGDWHE
jgi:hypothetical protein